MKPKVAAVAITPLKMKNIGLFTVVALVIATSLPAQNTVKEGNTSLHLLREALRRYADVKQCDDADWPDTSECANAALRVARSAKILDLDLQSR